MGFSAGINLYAYAYNDPINYVDPDGRYATPVSDTTKETIAGVSQIVMGARQIVVGATLLATPETVVGPIMGAANIYRGVTNVVEGVKSVFGDEPQATNVNPNLSRTAEKDPYLMDSRYQGAKPIYHVNLAHVQGSAQFNPKKTPLPGDAADVFKRAVPDSATNARHWYGKNKDGVTYRFSNANDGTAHFSGHSNFGDGIRNITPYAKNRLKDF